MKDTTRKHHAHVRSQSMQLLFQLEQLALGMQQGIAHPVVHLSRILQRHLRAMADLFKVIDAFNDLLAIVRIEIGHGLVRMLLPLDNALLQLLRQLRVGVATPGHFINLMFNAHEPSFDFTLLQHDGFLYRLTLLLTGCIAKTQGMAAPEMAKALPIGRIYLDAYNFEYASAMKFRARG
jgi:hypothetical protein